MASMDSNIVKAQLAATEADTAMQSGNFHLVYQKYEEAANLYLAAMQRASEPKTVDSLKLFYQLYTDKARHMADYLESDQHLDHSLIDSAISMNGISDDEDAEASDDAITISPSPGDASVVTSALQFDDHHLSNFDYYYHQHRQQQQQQQHKQQLRLNTVINDSSGQAGPVTPNGSTPPSPRQAHTGPSSPPDNQSSVEKHSTSPLEKWVQPFTKGYQTVKNFVYSTAHTATTPTPVPRSTKPSNSLEESFFFVPQYDERIPEGGRSAFSAPSAPFRKRSASESPAHPSQSHHSTPRSGKQPANVATPEPTVIAPPGAIVVNEKEYTAMVDEIQRLQAALMKLRDTNIRLMQINNGSGMHTLVRENTQLKRSLINFQRSNKMAASGIVGTTTIDSSLMGGLPLPPISSSTSVQPPKSPRSEVDDKARLIIDLRTENGLLKQKNEQLEHKIQQWKDRWDKLKATAIEKRSAKALATTSPIPSNSTSQSSAPGK